MKKVEKKNEPKSVYIEIGERFTVANLPSLVFRCVENPKTLSCDNCCFKWRAKKDVNAKRENARIDVNEVACERLQCDSMKRADKKETIFKKETKQ